MKYNTKQRELILKYLCEKEGEHVKAEDILELLEDIGTIPEEVREKITGEIDLEILKKWHKLAAKSESIDEFVSKM